MRKYSLFGMCIYYRILVTLYFNKFHPTDTTSLKIASFTRSGISTKSSDYCLQIFRGVLIVYTRKKKKKKNVC